MVTASRTQVEALRATDLQRAAAALENLPSGSKAVAQLSETTAKQLTAFSEAFEYVLGEVEEKGKARVRLKEQVDNVKELQVCTVAMRSSVFAANVPRSITQKNPLGRGGL